MEKSTASKQFIHIRYLSGAAGEAKSRAICLARLLTYAADEASELGAAESTRLILSCLEQLKRDYGVGPEDMPQDIP